MGEVIPFDFETNAVRVVLVDNAPWFVAPDVCRVLDHKNPTVALRRLDEDEKRLVDPKLLLGSSVAGGGAQMMSIVSESGLYALILTSNKPAAKRFRKWVTAEVLPSIRRDGAYFATGEDRALLAAKRAYYAALPESHRDKAGTKAEVVAQVEALIAQGWKVGEAQRAVAAEFGISERSIYYARRAVYMVAQADHAAALAPRWAGPRGMMVECHPEAMQFWIRLVGSGARITDCYRRLCDAAAENGWGPIPSERTMRRVGERLLPRDIARPLSRKGEKAA